MTKEEMAYGMIKDLLNEELYNVGVRDGYRAVRKGFIIGACVTASAYVGYKLYRGWNVAKEEMEEQNNEI